MDLKQMSSQFVQFTNRAGECLILSSRVLLLLGLSLTEVCQGRRVSTHWPSLPAWTHACQTNNIVLPLLYV